MFMRASGCGEQDAAIFQPLMGAHKRRRRAADAPFLTG
jgi:hypothetical protein